MNCTFISVLQKEGKCGAIRSETPSEINGDYESCEMLCKYISKKATATQILKPLLFSRRAQNLRPAITTTTLPYAAFVTLQS